MSSSMSSLRPAKAPSALRCMSVIGLLSGRPSSLLSSLPASPRPGPRAAPPTGAAAGAGGDAASSQGEGAGASSLLGLAVEGTASLAAVGEDLAGSDVGACMETRSAPVGDTNSERLMMPKEAPIGEWWLSLMWLALVGESWQSAGARAAMSCATAPHKSRPPPVSVCSFVCSFSLSASETAAAAMSVATAPHRSRSSPGSGSAAPFSFDSSSLSSVIFLDRAFWLYSVPPIVTLLPGSRTSLRFS
mmetsp:Transcript_107347/g.303500  ORF Transcript_107347/g.303500 Transcript_107347/m.303500 type:complete len:246 (-) Transcript_107347:2848-3585(-)